MSATNFPEFNAAVTELTLKVQNLLGSVATMQSVANVQVAIDKAAAASTSASEAATSAASSASSASAANTSKNAASASETKAAKWADSPEGTAVETGKYSAKHHALKAAASATSASTSAATATTKAGEASSSATNAASSASTASTKASEAVTSASGAGASELKAAKWADANENTAVETGKYSAKHHALKAASSETSASGSASTASTKAEEASASASSAATSASTATSKASAAATSATTASTKASEASTSATSASTSATKASQWADADEGTAVEAGKYSAKHHALKSAASATAASSSQSSASGSASTASTKADEASTSATSASGSASTASTKAEEASASASSAATSATTATTKAADASNSATTAGTKASEAASSASGSLASMTKAGQWAEANENTEVESGKFSAKHHALKAAASATSAASSASSASGSASTATSEASAAATSAADAAASESTASAKASAAATSATNAESANSSAQSAKTAAEDARDEAISAAAAVTGALIELGSVNLSGEAYPSKPATGAFWKVTVGGTVGGVDYGVGDTLVYSKNLDQFYKIDNTESVSSVNGKTGVVSLTAADVGAVPTTGNAASATKLATARTINGVAFDGSANITVADATKLPLTGGTLTGALNLTSASKSLAITTSGVERGFIEADTYGIRIRSRAADTTVAGSITLGVDGATTVTGNLTVGGTASGNGSGLTALNASNLASGTIPDARLSGTYTGVSITGNAATATALQTARTINGVAFNGSANITVTAAANGGTSAACSGNAATATKLATARTINGVAFDGSANITVADSTKLPLTGGTMTGSITFQNVSVGGWARGFEAFIASTGALAAGLGFLGTSDSINNVYMGLGAAPWATGNGVRVTSSGVTIEGATNFTGVISGNGSGLTTLNAANITTGTIPAARVPTLNQSTTGNAGTANRAGVLNWTNFGGGQGVGNGSHVIFDASSSTSPSGGAVNNTNPVNAWAPTYPTLMGWNGSGTYGVRVDRARYAEALTSGITINGVAANVGSNITVADATKMPLAGGTFTGVVSTRDAGINSNSAGGSSALQVMGTASSGAVFSLHRGGAYAINIGLDTDNVFRIGGWSDGATHRMHLDPAGNFTARGNVTAYSDIRLKTDIQVIPDALTKVCALRGVTYERLDSGERQTGVIAQEVQAVLPEAVHDDGEHLSVAYGNLVGLLIESIKELSEKVRVLEGKLNGAT